MLDVIIPCFNEESIIEDFYIKTTEILKDIKYRLYFINDGSTDNTNKILKNIYNKDKKNVRIITFSRNFGKEAAILAGLKYSTAEYISIIDADLQQNPKYLLKMYKFLIENEEYDAITMCQKQTKNRHIRNMFYSIMDGLTDIHIEKGASDFRMFKKNVKESILLLNEKNRFSKGLFSYVGFNTYYDEYKVEKRKKGKTKWKTKDLFNYAARGITAFSIKPLRFVTYTGILASLIAIIYLIIIIAKTLIFGKDVAGYASLMSVILFIGALMLIGIGIVGEYIAKIYDEVKNRPTYITKERIGFDDDIL